MRSYLYGSLLLVALTAGVNQPLMANAIRFFGNGDNDIDRLKFQIADTDQNAGTAPAGPPLDVGATDFTIEFWIRTSAAGPAISCTSYNWIQGRVIVDRDRFNQDRAFGVAMAGGVIAFGVNGSSGSPSSDTVCSTTNIADDQWHHIAVQRRRSDGRMYIYVDGILEGEKGGPNGDVSYPDNGVPGNFCNGGNPCTFSDPYLVIGAEKHDASAAFPSYIGYFDELRVSTVLRYNSNFTPAVMPFVMDADTVGLYHLNEGSGNVITDTMGNTNGVRRVGGSPVGPAWTTVSPFAAGGSSSGGSSSGGSSSGGSSSGGSSSGGSSSRGSSGGSSGNNVSNEAPAPSGGGGALSWLGCLLLLGISRILNINRRYPLR